MIHDTLSRYLSYCRCEIRYLIGMWPPIGGLGSISRYIRLVLLLLLLIGQLVDTYLPIYWDAAIYTYIYVCVHVMFRYVS